MQPKKPWTLEQLAERVADHLESFTEAITRRKDIGEMARQTRQVYDIYKDYSWHDDGQVSEILGIKTDVAGARRRELKNDYGFNFADDQSLGFWRYRMLPPESPEPSA